MNQKFSNQLRKALRNAAETPDAISNATEITERQLCRFLQGGWLSEAAMDALTAHLRLIVVPRAWIYPEPLQGIHPGGRGPEDDDALFRMRKERFNDTQPQRLPKSP